MQGMCIYGVVMNNLGGSVCMLRGSVYEDAQRRGERNKQQVLKAALEQGGA